MVLNSTNQSLKNKKKTPLLEGVFFCAFGYDNDLRLLDKTMSSLDSVSKESIPNLAPNSEYPIIR